MGFMDLRIQGNEGSRKSGLRKLGTSKKLHSHMNFQELQALDKLQDSFINARAF
jgi:hypothetical protein